MLGGQVAGLKEQLGAFRVGLALMMNQGLVNEGLDGSQLLLVALVGAQRAPPRAPKAAHPPDAPRVEKMAAGQRGLLVPVAWSVEAFEADGAAQLSPNPNGLRPHGLLRHARRQNRNK